MNFIYCRHRLASQEDSLPREDNEDEDVVFIEEGKSFEVEYFFSSDPGTIINHTNRILYLEDGDVASVCDGGLTLHRTANKEELDWQELNEVQHELELIMKGEFDSFMQKEIFEQPEVAVNTMRGRLNFDKQEICLGGVRSHLHEIRRCRRISIIGCGTSYHAAITCRAVLEEMTELPVAVENSCDFVDRQAPIFRDDVCFFVSQSGETADTLKALKMCKRKGTTDIHFEISLRSTIVISNAGERRTKRACRKRIGQ